MTAGQSVPILSRAAIAACLLLTGVAGTAHAAEPTGAELEQRFTSTIRPFVKSYCVECHGAEKPKAQLDLGTFTSMSAVVRDYAHWSQVLEQLSSKEMPPEDAKKQPTAVERTAVISWIEAVRRFEAERHAGDPGVVLARRLSNAELDYTIRDLTGVDLRPTREFPVDPANQAGFDNSGESLTMSPALLKKYLQAARLVADHLVLKPDGFDFASHPVLAETDRDKYSILRIVDFYKRQPTDYADYFFAAWRYRHRAALMKPDATLSDIASEAHVSQKYLELVYATLTAPGETVGPIAKLQQKWQALPGPDAAQTEGVRNRCEELRNFVVDLRKKLAWRFKNLELKGVSSGGQCFILWKDRQYASHRRLLNPETLEVGGVPRPRPTPRRSKEEAAATPEPAPPGPDPDLFVPEDEAGRAPYVAAFERFCNVFPDAFYISERGRMHWDFPVDKGRLLSAGFHNMMGYFRDDTPLMEMILDDASRKELDRLWLEFDFVAFVPEREHAEFIFYERAESSFMRTPEFDFARSEDKEATSEAKLTKLAQVYLAKATDSLNKNGGDPMVLDVIADHFKFTNANIRHIETVRVEAEPTHLTALVKFVERAYRRPLLPAEREDVLGFYRQLRSRDGLSHEDAIRDSVASVLMSPHFCYRIDLLEAAGTQSPASAPPRSTAFESSQTSAPGKPGFSTALETATVQPLSDYSLASRLSYFLWSSMPDEELLSHAAKGDLHEPAVIAAQARRMLKDPRSRALAVEFGGNWLDFRRFEEHNAVDRNRFPAFNDELRQAMFEEPVRYLLDIMTSDRSVLDLLYGKHTFVNGALAKHYGIEGVNGSADRWVRVDNADRYERGGLLPMAVFQTANASGLRTSPVKRGYWVVRRVLGEQIPPPPAVVPELPKDEAQLGDITLRQALERHRQDKNCAACHARFDSFGLVFENFGPVGERREKDLGGKLVDTRATFPDGSDRTGLAGLRDYIRAERESDFVDQLSSKLLVYALGRGLMLSDDAALRQMREQLKAHDHRFGSLVECIVTSPQFLNKRASDDSPSR